jgi:hypothetical protein
MSKQKAYTWVKCRMGNMLKMDIMLISFNTIKESMQME